MTKKLEAADYDTSALQSAIDRLVAAAHARKKPDEKDVSICLEKTTIAYDEPFISAVQLNGMTQKFSDEALSDSGDLVEECSKITDNDRILYAISIIENEFAGGDHLCTFPLINLHSCDGKTGFFVVRTQGGGWDFDVDFFCVCVTERDILSELDRENYVIDAAKLSKNAIKYILEVWDRTIFS